MRERSLVLVMLGLAIVVISYFGIVRPLAESRATALQNELTAQQLFRFASVAAQEATALRAKQRDKTVAYDERSVRVIVAAAARAAGISISRIQPDENRGVTLWLDNTSSQKLYGWLTVLSREHNIAPQKVSLQKAGTPSGLRGQLQFDGAR